MVFRPIRPTRPTNLNRYFKLASAKNPSTDFIELNDLNGFLCTSFQQLGISRKFEFLEINNRQLVVSNKPSFKKYSLTIEILAKYSQYEAKHRELISFLDRNKKDGFRLYFRPYSDMDMRYCLCSIELSTRIDKLQPVVLTLLQNSLWFGETKKAELASVGENNQENLFSFSMDTVYGREYYSTKFGYEEDIGEYCIRFFGDAKSTATISNNSYNDIPLNINIYGPCINPEIFLYKAGESEPVQKAKIIGDIGSGGHIQIKADIVDNGVWIVYNNTDNKVNYEKNIDNSVGSPYFFVGNGDYDIVIIDTSGNPCTAEVFYQEEYSE